MRLNRLQALRAVMETGSVTEASRRIHRTQPQISRLISALEEEVGFSLFSRQGRGLIPTQECLRFYEGTRHILAGFEEVDRIAGNIRNQQDAWLRILTQPYFAYSAMPGAIAEFGRSHPQVRMSLEVRSRVDVGLWMSGQQFDLGVAALPIDFPGITSRTFAQVRLVIAMPEGHRLAAKRVVTATDIQDEPFIALRPYTLLRQHIDDLMEKRRLPLRLVMETSSGQSACQLAALGMGIALADPILAANVPGIVLRDFEPRLTMPYGFLLPSSYAPSEQAREFARLLIRRVKEMAPERVDLVALDAAEGDGGMAFP
ncbi:LysR family transcriptional regulator [Streptomyces cavourensis]|jgi:DNA-binding transcriptional LysR family regulator|uniref:LysR family transcriptional regulator n=1 Tax=unclassified Achromobacter TaxID=2626865 RepID=UPI000E05B462|nr:LysR family transcriptional regulator [Streptomyces cavourensis]